MTDREPRRLYPYQATVPFLEVDRKRVIIATNAKTIKRCVNVLNEVETTIGNVVVYNMTIGAVSKKSLAEFWGKFADLSGRNSTIVVPGPQPLSDTDTGKYKRRP